MNNRRKAIRYRTVTKAARLTASEVAKLERIKEIGGLESDSDAIRGAIEYTHYYLSKEADRVAQPAKERVAEWCDSGGDPRS
jgi:hypothetical protein